MNGVWRFSYTKSSLEDAIRSRGDTSPRTKVTITSKFFIKATRETPINTLKMGVRKLCAVIIVAIRPLQKVKG